MPNREHGSPAPFTQTSAVAGNAERRPRQESGAPDNHANSSTRISREVELKGAVLEADLPARDFKVFMVLMKRATWSTAEIQPRFQPRNLAELADWCRVSPAGLKRALSHLQRHGWILRYRHCGAKGIGGRGHSTHYQLDRGTDCSCIAPRPGPVSDAERMRNYRARKKAAQSPVTHTGKEAQPVVTQPEDKEAQIDVTTGEKLAQIDVTNRLSYANDAAGQGPVSAKSVRNEGSIKKERFKDTNGAAENPWPSARIPGVRGGPIPDDPGERQALKNLVSAFGPIEIIGAE